MLPSESENDGLTDGQMDGRMNERNFLNGGYNIIPRTFFKVAGYKNCWKWQHLSKHLIYPPLTWDNFYIAK